MGYSAVHLNGNLLCAVDTESSGLKAGFHELLQICILPLGPDLQLSKDFPHLELLVKPEAIYRADAEADRVNNGLLNKATVHGVDRWAAVELVRDWFYRLKLPERKKIVPLAANWIHDYGFIKEFMGGPESFDEIFRSDYRDVQKIALGINDMCDWHSEPIPFPKVNLSYLCSCLGIRQINKHDATGDAIATAEVYRRLMRYKDFWNPVPVPVTDIYDELIVQYVAGFERAVDKKAYLRQILARTGREIKNPA